jgi:hypothetical protein
MQTRHLAMSGFVLIATFNLGCGRQPSSLTGPTAVPAAKSMVQAINVASGTSAPGPLRIGDTIQFKATAQLADGTTADVSDLAEWSSDNSSVATVNTSGLVTATGPGTANVTARYQEATGVFAVAVRAMDAAAPASGTPGAGSTPPGHAPNPPSNGTPPNGFSPNPNPSPSPSPNPSQPCSSPLPVTLPSPLPPCPDVPPVPANRG